MKAKTTGDNIVLQIKMIAKNDKIKLAVMARDVKYIRGEVKEIKERLDDQYVTKTEFDPIKKVVYGIIALILTAVVGALVGLVLIK